MNNPWSFVLKLEYTGQAYYVVWSTRSDAPMMPGMLLAKFKEYYQTTYGEDALEFFEARMLLLDKTGCSRPGMTLEKAIENNRAGPEEKHLTRDGLIRMYCLPQDNPPTRK